MEVGSTTKCSGRSDANLFFDFKYVLEATAYVSIGPDSDSNKGEDNLKFQLVD